MTLFQSHESVLFLLVLASFSNSYSRPDHLLRTIRYAEIDNIVENSCLLVGLQQSSLALLINVSVVYENDNTVYIALLENTGNQLYSSLKWSKGSREASQKTNLAFFRKKVKDRSCLLVPPSAPLAEAYPGPLTAAALVQFINERCDGFRTVTGGISPAGVFHSHIMNNLYHTPSRKSSCTRLKTLSTREEFFTNYLTRSQPVVFEGAAKHWPAMKKWTMSYLEQKYGEKEVHIKMTRDGCYEGVEAASLWPGYSEQWIPQEVRQQLKFPDLVVVRPATAEMKFSDFLQLVSAGANLTGLSAYLEYSSIPYYMPELEQDILEMPFVRDLLERRHLNMWLSDGNTLGKLHFDPYDNMLCQISGKKHLVLFDPHHNENLYEAHIPEALLGYKSSNSASGGRFGFGGKFYRQQLLESTSMVMSPVDILNPDLNRFPLFSQASRLECTLSPGDVLFMPAFWWHEVQSQPDTTENRNLAVNYWYEPLLTKEFPCSTCRLHYNTKHYQQLLDNPPQQ